MSNGHAATWQFPPNEAGKVFGWSDDASPSNPNASLALVNRSVSEGPVQFRTFSNVNEASGSNIPPVIDEVQVLNYATAGDGGGGRYVRALSEPSHAGKFQSANGAWWELVEREAVKPEQFGAIATDDAYGEQTASDANTAANTVAFQAMLDYCAATGATIFLPGRYYVGALVPSAPVVMRGRDWKSSGVFFDSTSVETWLDFSTNDIDPAGSVFQDFMLVSTLGRDSTTNQSGIRLRITGSNRNVTFSRFWLEDFSLTGIDASDTFNCIFEDIRIRRVGQPGVKGRGLYLLNRTFSSSTATTGNKIKNVYASGCRYGIEADGSLSYQQLEQVFCESCTVGVYAPSSNYATLIGCYFEANVVAGAQLQSGGVIQSRFSIGGTDDVTFSSRYFRLTDLVVEIGRGSTVLFKADNAELVQSITDFLVTKIKMKPTTGSHSPEIKAGTGSPESAVVGSPGDLWLRNASFAPIYHKRSGTATNTGWAAMQPVIAGTTASRPTLPAEQAGYVYLDTTLGKWIGWSGSAWLNVDGSAL